MSTPAIQRKLPLKAMFKKLDKDHSGCLDRHEVRRLLDVMGLILLDKEFETAWKEVDGDNSGVVEYGEFEEWFWKTQSKVRKPHSETRRPGDLRKTFQSKARKAAVLAVGGYRAILSNDLYKQIHVMNTDWDKRTEEDLDVLMKDHDGSDLTDLYFMGMLTPESQRTAGRHLTCTVMPANTVMVEQGEAGADRVYMILAGSCACYKHSDVMDDVMVKCAEHGQYDHFGK